MKTAARAERACTPGKPSCGGKTHAPAAPVNPGWAGWALQVAPGSDPLEREADSLARTVAGGRSGSNAAPPPPQAEACPACRSGETGPLVLGALAQAGTAPPMRAGTRRRLESRLGLALSDVRVHEDARAHQATAALQARAFTRGQDIWLGRGETQADLSLMAHESAHVLQQRAGRSASIQRQALGEGAVGFTSADGATGMVPPGPAMSLPPALDGDPCRLAVSTLTNAELVAQWLRVVNLMGPRRPDSPEAYDLANLRGRLARERQRRGRQGHCWLAESGLTGVPAVLYEMRSGGPLTVLVTFADAGREAGLPFEHLGQVLTPAQFSRFLEQHGVPQISLEDYLAATGGAEGPMVVRLPPPPPLLGTSLVLPSSASSGLVAAPLGPAATAGLLPTDLYANPTDLFSRRSFLSPVITPGTNPASPDSVRGAGVNWRGTMLESLHFGRDLATWRDTTDLNTLRPNFETFDGIVLVDGRPTALESITHSTSDGFYATKFARMLNPNAEGATLNAAAGALGAEFPTIASGLDAASMARLLVPDEHVARARAEAVALVDASHVRRADFADFLARRLAEPLTRIQPTYAAMLDASLAAQPVVRGSTTYSQWSQVAALNPRTAECRAVRAELARRLDLLARSGDLRTPAPGSVEALLQAAWRREAGSALVGPMFDALLHGNPIGTGPNAITNWSQLEALMLSGDPAAAARANSAFSDLSGRASARVMPAGATMRALLTLEALNRQAGSRFQRNQLFPPEVVEYHRLVASGVAPEAAESTVLRGSGMRGALMGGGLTALVEGGGLVHASINGTLDGRRVAMASYNVSASVPVGYAGAALETRAALNLSSWATRGLAAGEVPGLAATSGVVGGRLFVSTGVGAVAAPVITLGGMAFQETFLDGDFSRIDYAAAGVRTAAAGGGGALAAGVTGALLGSEVPLLGNAVGFVVGFGGYLVVDAIWGDDIESAVREGLGENGCVGRTPPP